jgi:hypothetical protein
LGKYKNQSLWPGFRVVLLKRERGINQIRVQILEPSFYWRMNRDYDTAPFPHIIYFDVDRENLFRVKNKIESVTFPRIILHQRVLKRQNLKPIERDLVVWANDSIGIFRYNYALTKKRYQKLPSIKKIRHLDEVLVDDILKGMRNCMRIFAPPKGNRTCFQICD